MSHLKYKEGQQRTAIRATFFFLFAETPKQSCDVDADPHSATFMDFLQLVKMTDKHWEH